MANVVAEETDLGENQGEVGGHQQLVPLVP